MAFERIRTHSFVRSLTPRALVGIAVALALALWLVVSMMARADNDAPVVLVSPPVGGAAPVAPIAPVVVVPSSVPVPVGAPVSAAPTATATATAATGSADGLILFGVSGFGARGSAIVGDAPDAQRYIRAGSFVRPGIRLIGVDRTGAILDRAGTRLRLSLMTNGASKLAEVAAVPAALVRVADPTERQRQETQQFTRALAPIVKDGRVLGYTITDSATVPVFVRAGVKPGDVLISVNGRGIVTDADIATLSHEIDASKTMRFEIERGGVRQTLRLDL